MKTTNALAALSLATLSLAACASPSSADDAHGSSAATADLTDTSPASPAAATGATVYRGGFEAMGRRFSLEVELTSKQIVKQTKYCDAGGRDESPFAGVSASPDYEAGSAGGQVRTIVRDAAGAIVGEASYAIAPFSAYTFDVDVTKQCKSGGRLVADVAPATTFSHASPLVWVPGVIASTAEGAIWINPSYLGVDRVYVSFDGTATYEARSSKTSLHPRPFGGVGQELVFEEGELTFEPGPSTISLEIGTDIDPSGSHARDRRAVSLARSAP
ncbi:MAG: hypothetical protein U0270_27495 [Labilithrix sp.]